MYSRNLFILDFAKNRPQKQVQERLRENILDNGGYKLEELTIDNTPVKNEKDQEAVIEAVLFTMGGAVELKQLAVSIGQDKETAKAAVDRLMKRYKTGKHGMEILQLEDSYQMCTQSKYYSNLIRIASAPKKQVLSDVVLETLSIIAYRQPVTKLEIEKIRGVKSDHAVNRLVEYNLVYEAGRLDAPGRPALFATTEEFMRRFGIGALSDLPDMNPAKEDEIRAEVEEELKYKLEEMGSNDASEEALELLEAAVTREQNNKENNQ